MKVLIVCSSTNKKISPFIQDQVISLEKLGVIIDFYTISKPGIIGYLLALNSLKIKIKTYEPDIIHAHYGLSGLLANMQRKVSVITTFHGSDINSKRIRKYSRIASCLSKANIFVSESLINLMPSKRTYHIPCGVDTTIFFPKDKKDVRLKIGLDLNKTYILFSSAFDNVVKNYTLAKRALSECGKDIVIMELKGYSRKEVSDLMNAVDICLLTSFSEGSPQFIKEAMSCDRPIVSTNVGDVKWLFQNTNGLFLSEFNASSIAANIDKALNFEKSCGRNRIKSLKLDADKIAQSIIEIYNRVKN